MNINEKWIQFGHIKGTKIPVPFELVTDQYINLTFGVEAERFETQWQVVKSLESSNQDGSCDKTFIIKCSLE